MLASLEDYPPGSPSIKLGKARAKPTVIEAVADELGVYFRNVLYQDRRCPLDPDSEKVAETQAVWAVLRWDDLPTERRASVVYVWCRRLVALGEGDRLVGFPARFVAHVEAALP